MTYKLNNTELMVGKNYAHNTMCSNIFIVKMCSLFIQFYKKKMALFCRQSHLTQHKI